MSKVPKIFLSYARVNRNEVHALYERLIGEGFDPWLDTEELLPGQDWELEITKAVKHVDVVLVCLSGNSVNREGYAQKEIRFALDIADRKPPGTIFIIPARLEDCPVPERLEKIQWVDLFEEEGWGRLVKSIRSKIPLITEKDGEKEKEKEKNPPNYLQIVLDSSQLWSDRLAALDQIDLAQPEQLKSLGQLVNDRKSPEDLRRLTIMRLCEVRDKMSRDALEQIWRDSSNSPAIMEAAAQAFAIRGELMVLSSIYNNLNETRRTVVKPILKKLAETEPAAIHILMPELEEGTVQERLEAIEQLRENSDRGTVKCLVDLMLDTKGQPLEVRKAAALALGEMRLHGELRSAALPPLINAVQRDQDEQVRLAARWSLIALGEIDKVPR